MHVDREGEAIAVSGVIVAKSVRVYRSAAVEVVVKQVHVKTHAQAAVGQIVCLHALINVAVCCLVRDRACRQVSRQSTSVPASCTSQASDDPSIDAAPPSQ